MALGGIDQPLITYLAFSKYLKRSGNTIRTCQLFIDFEKAYDFIKKESLYIILITICPGDSVHGFQPVTGNCVINCVTDYCDKSVNLVL